MRHLTLTIAALLFFSPFTAQFATADVIDYSCTDCPQTIGPDPETITSTITVADTGTIDELTVVIEFLHTYTGDLMISLMHDAINVVLLVPDNTNNATYTGGTYGPLGAFVGSELSGIWTLTVVDNFLADAGELIDWRLSGNYTPPTPPPAHAVPEPGTLALLGLGLAGMGITRRKKTV